MLELIKYILQDINQVLGYALWAGCITAVLSFGYVLFCKGTKRKLGNRKKNLLMGLLVFYVILILIISIFSREPGSRVGVSLILGETWTREWQGRAYVIEIVLLYIPFGMLGMGVCYYVNRRGIYVVLASFLLSLTVEVTQYVTQMGYFQVDDLITNTLGTLLAVILCKFIQLIFKFITSCNPH